MLADPRVGFHLMHAMSQPKAEALALLEDFQRLGSVDLGPMRVDRAGNVGHVTIQNHAFLNSEDDVSTAALETAVDLVLLDDEIQVGVLRGAPATHPKYAGRRIFGSGINLTHLYYGKISLLEFMLERELGAVSKMYRGHDLGAFDEVGLENRREKPWIAAVDTFAIGGACQWLLVMDSVVAESGSYFNLPARKEGIIPGCADLRLPRFVGERLTRQAIFFNRELPADSAGGAADRRRGRAPGRDGARRRALRGRADERRDDEPDRQPPGLACRAGAARRLSPLHGGLRPRPGPLSVQPGPDRQPRAQLGREAPEALTVPRRT